jgi:hypothetical protein
MLQSSFANWFRRRYKLQSTDATKATLVLDAPGKDFIYG